jgi:molybdopterin-guanine dinucleotide biosynthesis protein A
METQKNLAILILIGGKSTRFGVEKAVINVLGKPLILHQIETLSNIDEDVFLVAHSPEQIYEYRENINFPEEIRFIVDDREFFKHPNIFKPMLGIYSGFKHLNKEGFEKAFVLSCDMPLIKADVIEFMIKQSENYECCIPRWENGFLEPYFAIYPVNKGLTRAKDILTIENYGLLNLIDKNWKINYISVEKSIKPLDDKLVSLINIKGPIDISKLLTFYK